jgi:hypothetical protein
MNQRGYSSLVVEMYAGSTLYGTRTPESDTDLKRVVIPTAHDILLGSVVGAWRDDTREDRTAKMRPGDSEIETFTLCKFLKLVADGQTVALDMLFTPPEQIIWASPLWEQIQEQRGTLLWKGLTAFVGYCVSQVHKYNIKGERLAAISRIHRAFRNGFLGKHNPHQTVGEYLNSQDFQCLLQELKDEGLTEFLAVVPGEDGLQYLEILGKKVSETARMKLALEVAERIESQYGERSKAARENSGVDWKGMSQAVRIVLEAQELLETRNIMFPRPEASELLRIRSGKIPYEEVVQRIETGIQRVKTLMETSVLPDSNEHIKAYARNLIKIHYAREVLRDLTVEESFDA